MSSVNPTRGMNHLLKNLCISTNNSSYGTGVIVSATFAAYPHQADHGDSPSQGYLRGPGSGEVGKLARPWQADRDDPPSQVTLRGPGGKGGSREMKDHSPKKIARAGDGDVVDASKNAVNAQRNRWKSRPVRSERVRNIQHDSRR